MKIANRYNIKVALNRSYCDEKIIKRTYGFEYDAHFRFMLIRLVGLINVERLEQQVDPAKHIQMTAALKFLKPLRDIESELLRREDN